MSQQVIGTVSSSSISKTLTPPEIDIIYQLEYFQTHNNKEGEGAPGIS